LARNTLPSELVGKSIWRIVHPDDRSRIQQQVQNSFQRQLQESSFEFRVVACSAMILSDEVLLQRIIRNFVSNAIHQHSLAGGFQILQKPVDCENLITCIDHPTIGAGVCG
jgi:light-regulated signal transduction histidine kinase (bacteriophytochrome)